LALIRSVAVTAMLAIGLALSGCKLVKNEQQASADGGVDIFFDDKSFDPDKMAREMWDSKVIPYLDQKAGLFAEIKAAIAKDPDQAGRTYGYREKEEGSPWTLVARLEGRIIAANTESRAATIDVDIDNDNVADAAVQIGPVIRGTALRDSLDFVSFNAFTNQIDFAKFAKSLNTHMSKMALARLPREDLVGRTVSLVGVFALEGKSAKPLVTPATIRLGDKAS
jgi:predicted lipoprotein